jgi:signal transduction histidine kinase
VTLAVAAGVGWLVALGAGLLALGLRRRLAAWLELVARAAHEVRGSMTAARLAVKPGDASPARLRALDLELGRAAVAVEDLVESCARRPVERELGLLDVRQLLADSVEAWQPFATEQRASLRLSWLGRSASVWGERYRLAQATGNLIANAIEHGDGEVQVLGRLDGASVRVEVTDRGPGLPAPVRELVRGARGGTGRHGRGLAIASTIARDHGGRLAAAPSERGARLVLELPAAPATAAEAGRAAGRPAQ